MTFKRNADVNVNVYLIVKSNLSYIFMFWLLDPSQVYPGATLNSAKGLGLGNQHTKFQLPSIKGAHVITSKRNADVNAKANLNIIRLATNLTNIRMNVRAYEYNITRKRYMPTAAFCRRGHKIPSVWKTGEDHVKSRQIITYHLVVICNVTKKVRSVRLRGRPFVFRGWGEGGVFFFVFFFFFFFVFFLFLFCFLFFVFFCFFFFFVFLGFFCFVFLCMFFFFFFFFFVIVFFFYLFFFFRPEFFNWPREQVIFSHDRRHFFFSKSVNELFYLNSLDGSISSRRNVWLVFINIFYRNICN